MRTRIVEESMKQFDKNGFTGTSIVDITQALDVTKGTFYYYFDSKEKLLMEIHLMYIKNLLEKQQVILQQPMNATKKLEAIVELLLHSILSDGLSGRVFFREMRHLKNNNEQTIITYRKKFRQNIEKVLLQGMANGEIKKGHVKIVALGILGVTNWSYQWFDENGDVSIEELTTIFVNMILTGIKE
ncbi:TetR/AcrR family transcriptional regulator [Kurthia sibirica]|uniref:TetR family transcriptional regulator n=1 Tax=Kurthia sibirica TaxID=202750 RepID=A0A2U3AR58_9BACL|nr:TetR/AcrR family transcriptional regulator [Kurthia sibirica]PWI27023.1 TetR family transcriptional regulator [Kurthia sibirica]GEK35327.1 TetR family transcriptional regulator [Kurthia sibirica]